MNKTLAILSDALLSGTLAPTLRVLLIPKSDIDKIRRRQYQEDGGPLRPGAVPFTRLRRYVDDCLRTRHRSLRGYEPGACPFGCAFLLMYDTITRKTIHKQ